MHNYLFKIPKSLLSSVRLGLTWLLVMACALVSSNSFAKLVEVNLPAVGQVTLLIGDTRVTGPNRKGSARLQTGAAIYPGDIIHTRASGHAHLRFIDGALMSVRPASRLTIEAYNYDPKIPANNRVSFKLEEGIARSISGKAAKDARENFRMNTPVAAIGVRGTDFIVHTNLERTRALVTEGGIVLSGLDTGCVGGWCGELELRSGSQQLLEMDLVTNEPRLMRSSFDEVLTSTALNSNMALVQVQAIQEGLLAEHKVVVPVVAEEASIAAVPTPAAAPALATVETVENKPSEPEPLVVAANSAPAAPFTPAPSANSQTTENQATENQATGASIGSVVANTPVVDNQVAVVDTSISNTSIANNQVAANTTSDTKGKDSLINNEIITPSDLLIIPEMAQVPEAVINTALVWGYLNTNNDAVPEFVQTQDAIATLENTHHETNITNSAYALYRRNEYNQEMNQFLPELQFALNDGAAWLNWRNFREPMSVESGMLVIDFDRSVFSTQLQLNHEHTGQIFFNASGTTEKTGYFNHSSNTKSLQGVVSLDAKEAAYLFNETLRKVEGQVEGITHWGIKK